MPTGDDIPSGNLYEVNFYKLLKIRGKLMQNSYKENMSGMDAVIGINCSKLYIIYVELFFNKLSSD